MATLLGYVNFRACLQLACTPHRYRLRQSSDLSRLDFSGWARAARGCWLESWRPTPEESERAGLKMWTVLRLTGEVNFSERLSIAAPPR